MADRIVTWNGVPVVLKDNGDNTFSMLQVQQGGAAHDAAVAGNPVLVAGRGQSSLPTGTQNGDATNIWTSLNGAVMIGVASGTAGDANANSAIGTIYNLAGTATYLGVAPELFNSASWDRQRNNVESSLIASAARTATNQTADQTNFNGRGIHVILDVTNAGTGSITLSIEAKDPVSGNYYTLLAGAAVTTISTNVYKVYPGLPATANVSANDFLPRTFRVKVTHNNANSITYSVGGVVVL